jgi:hypothetical protein
MRGTFPEVLLDSPRREGKLQGTGGHELVGRETLQVTLLQRIHARGEDSCEEERGNRRD